MKINFDMLCEGLRQMRQHLMERAFTDPIMNPQTHHRAEYCYQLISLLHESQRVINGEPFDIRYISEKTGTLSMIADAMDSDNRNANRNQER